MCNLLKVQVINEIDVIIDDETLEYLQCQNTSDPFYNDSIRAIIANNPSSKKPDTIGGITLILESELPYHLQD
ncbi:hypothetical protein My1_015 [Pectobacterium phage My1]|uniref:Uncharacterized protein n=1 Tax=Pectobacterium phage My1 TaxID=1204539 RepID=J9QKX4_9CAUD|nr:hypothetical protein My1_015 [Pectobacterium phage My1]AFQ22174.1 hypothetical protein My1_015 [Pectobacterium phage My1]